MGGSHPKRPSRRDGWAEIHRRHSVASRAELLELGITRRQIERRLESGRITALHEGVYLLAAVAPPLAHEIAAVLACGPGAYLSHASSRHLYSLIPRLPKPPKPEVTVVGRDVRPPGIRVHRVQELHPADVTTHKRIPTTTPARTLLDLAARLNERQLEQALAEALRRRLVRPPTLHSLLARHPGRPGTPALRSLLESGAPAFTRSELEEAFLALIRQAGLPEPELNAELCGYEIDALWRSQRLAVELDSWSWHSDRVAFEADRARDAWLVARGYRTMRFTWRQIRDDAVAVAARLGAALAASAR